jgi:hypothetical protein
MQADFDKLINFNFEKFVINIVVEAIKHSPKVRDALYSQANSTINNLIIDKLNDVKVVLQPAFEEIKDAVVEAEQDLDEIEEDLSDLESRVDALEIDFTPEEDFEELEQDFIIQQQLFSKFLPLLEALNKATPLLRMLKLIDVNEKKPAIHKPHPKTYELNLSDEQKPTPNWLS